MTSRPAPAFQGAYEPMPPPAGRPWLQPGPCGAPECPEPTRLYPAGWLCDTHMPGARQALPAPPARPGRIGPPQPEPELELSA